MTINLFWCDPVRLINRSHTHKICYLQAVYVTHHIAWLSPLNVLKEERFDINMLWAETEKKPGMLQTMRWIVDTNFCIYGNPEIQQKMLFLKIEYLIWFQYRLLLELNDKKFYFLKIIFTYWYQLRFEIVFNLKECSLIRRTIMYENKNWINKKYSRTKEISSQFHLSI